MSEARRRKLPETGILLLLQVVCALAAIGSLPRGLIHPAWILAFVTPAALFLFLGTGLRRQYIPAWLRFSIAAIAQGLTAYAAYSQLGPLDEKSSLACSLLPALTYFTLRREPSDTSLSLFLSFCFLLIGVMLNDDIADWTLLVFLAACAWAMQIEARNRAMSIRHAARGPMMSLAARSLRRAQVVASLMLTALLLYQAIELIPSPGSSSKRRGSAHANANNGRMLGLNNRFDLSGSEGSPLNLTSSQVIRVTGPGRHGVPTDLYLRMTYFDQAFDNEEWKTRTPRYHPNRVGRGGFFVREEIPGLTRHWISVTRIEQPTEGEIFLPPGAIQITGISSIQHDSHAGHFRTHDPSNYGVLYQRPHKRRRFRGIDPMLASGRGLELLTELPAGLRTPQLREMARKYAPPRGQVPNPMRLARRIAADLTQLCRYKLQEPSGPYPDALHNFLFGKHEGYCMHFATALAVLLRLNRVPCRIGVGFHAGQDDHRNGRIFGSQHAHAWVELPLLETGWTLIDPTPSADRARRGWPDPKRAEEQGAPLDEAAGGMFGAGCFLRALMDPLQNPGTFLALAIVLVMITVGIALMLARRNRASQLHTNTPKPTPDEVKARRLLDQILQALAKLGHAKNHRATLEQYAGYLDSREDQLDATVMREAFDAYQEVRFGAKRFDDDRHTQMASALTQIKSIG